MTKFCADKELVIQLPCTIFAGHISYKLVKSGANGTNILQRSWLIEEDIARGPTLLAADKFLLFAQDF